MYVAYAKMVKRPNFGCPLISAFLGQWWRSACYMHAEKFISESRLYLRVGDAP